MTDYFTASSLQETCLPAKRLKDLIVQGEAACLVLGENEIPVNNHIEDAAFALDQLRLRAEVFGYCGRQTGGLGKVVSRYTVGD